MKQFIVGILVLGVCLIGANVFAEGIDTDTVLMLHFNGSDGSTSFPDDSYSSHSVTAYGNIQIDTAESKFGGAAALFDGVGDYLSILDSDDWYFDGDFTVDFWVRFTDLPPLSGYIDYMSCSQIGTIPGDHFHFGLRNQDGIYYWRMLTSIDNIDTVEVKKEATVAVGTWYHIALVRSGNNYYIFQDGTQVGTTTIDSMAWNNYDTFFAIGSYGSGDPFDFMNGWIDEFRVSRGIARWISNFTPLTQEYDTAPPIPNEPPIAYAGDDVIAYAGDEVELDGSASYDTDGNIVSWVWRSLSEIDNPIVAEGEITTMTAHGYVEEIIELSITDDRGATITDTMRIIPEEIAALKEQISTLQGLSEQQQQIIDDNRYLIEQLPQLKKELEALLPSQP